MGAQIDSIPNEASFSVTQPDRNWKDFVTVKMINKLVQLVLTCIIEKYLLTGIQSKAESTEVQVSRTSYNREEDETHEAPRPCQERSGERDGGVNYAGGEQAVR